MKKLLSVLVFVAAAQGAFARSLVPSLIEFRNLPKSSDHRLSTEYLTVYVTGDVVSRDCLPAGIAIKPCIGKLVTRLSDNQLDRIGNLIERARSGKVRFEPSGVRCIMPATHIETYAAGRLVLREGAACDGGYKVNQSHAARSLVTILDHLRSVKNGSTTDLGMDLE